ncbi:hypothetical protein [Brevibacillus sp. SYSU BS000544]
MEKLMNAAGLMTDEELAEVAGGIYCNQCSSNGNYPNSYTADGNCYTCGD